MGEVSRLTNRCYCFFFYIKPQPYGYVVNKPLVVIVFFSTSNHNHMQDSMLPYTVVIVFFSTSNHNLPVNNSQSFRVVIVFFSTSNHNFFMYFSL